MEITTKGLIQFLPFDPEFRRKLLLEFDDMDQNIKYDVVQIIWDAFDTLYELKLEENINKALLEAKKGKRNITKDMYSEINQLTKSQIEKEYSQQVDQSNITEARKAMEMIVREIQAAKKDKQAKKATN